MLPRASVSLETMRALVPTRLSTFARASSRFFMNSSIVKVSGSGSATSTGSATSATSPSTTISADLGSFSASWASWAGLPAPKGPRPPRDTSLPLPVPLLRSYSRLGGLPSPASPSRLPSPRPPRPPPGVSFPLGLPPRLLSLDTSPSAAAGAAALGLASPAGLAVLGAASFLTGALALAAGAAALGAASFLGGITLGFSSSESSRTEKKFMVGKESDYLKST
mmetsp:Transcript_24656/g.54791  ORF Transcript_24656/g.54791 Transcript_24656/m.54791 type:complete len:223 (+) Transcript_24656:212-880(+)